MLLSINAQTYLFEAANVRHEHEYRIWERVKLPEGKILAPGVVSHATPLIEHPDLVSERIQRFARLVGPQNVIASTDCGLGPALPPADRVGEAERTRRGRAPRDAQPRIAGRLVQKLRLTLTAHCRGIPGWLLA